MNPRHMLLAGIALLLVITPGAIQAQDDDDDGHIFAVSTYQWPFNNLEEIFEIMEETQELAEQNEFWLSNKVLTHQWGGDFSVMFITEYASFDDIAKGQARWTELYRAKYPNERVRETRAKKLAALTGDGIHKDDIVQENTTFTK